jgi:hypothetical protein
LLTEPSMLTTVPTKKFWLGPGLAVGATLTVAVVVAAVPPPQPDNIVLRAKNAHEGKKTALTNWTCSSRL